MVRLPSLYRKRSREVCMSRVDNAWFTEILREAISPLEFLLIDENERRVEQVDSLAGNDAFVMITSPEPGGATLKQLRLALQFTHDCLSEPFRSTLPSRAVLYIPSEKVICGNTRYEGKGMTIETFWRSLFHFTYRRDDDDAHAFANRFIRLINKHLISQFLIINPETGRIVHEVLSGASVWAGPDVVEWCRQAPNRFICSAPGGGAVEHRFAPWPIEPEKKAR